MPTRYPEILLKKHNNGKADWWEVVEPVRVRCPLNDYGRFVIHAGYTTDFASVPQLFWWLVPPHGRTANACVVHDYLYEHKPVKASRKEVDRFWRELLRESGVKPWQVWLMYGYVRAFGWVNWKN